VITIITVDKRPTPYWTPERSLELIAFEDVEEFKATAEFRKFSCSVPDPGHFGTDSNPLTRTSD
jgi:hypothetical protein